MDRSYILALDIGSSSVRASLYGCAGHPIPRMSVKIERSLVSTPDGGAEIDADEACDQVAEAIDRLLERSARLNGPIELVAASSFWHSLVGVDAKGKPTTKVFGWADTRSLKYVDVLKKRFDEQEAHDRTGARFHSSFWPAKLLWLKKERPHVFARTAHWMSLSDYLALRLFGSAETSVSMASGTGIFNIRECRWDREFAGYLGLRLADLPHVIDTDASTFQLLPKYRRRWPRLKDARWFPAIADGAADNIGSGCVTRQRAALMVGTSGAMRVVFTGEPPATIPPGLWCYRVDRKRVIVGGALSDGGGLYHWLTNTLILPRDAEDQIARRAPGEHGLMFLPFLAGERSTGYHGAATGAILGLRTATGPIDILQAAMESVAFRFAEILDQLKTTVKVSVVVASGGALRDSPVWTQIIADVLGRDLTLSTASESSSHGAVLLALESIGKIGNIESADTPPTKGTAHRPDYHAAYNIVRKQHRTAYDLIINTRS